MIPGDESFWKQAFLAWASRYPPQLLNAPPSREADVCASFADEAVIRLQRRQKRGDDVYREAAPSSEDRSEVKVRKP
jgi:hypothetical protein